MGHQHNQNLQLDKYILQLLHNYKLYHPYKYQQQDLDKNIHTTFVQLFQQEVVVLVEG